MTERVDIIKKNYKNLYGEELGDDSIVIIAQEIITDRVRKYVKDNLNYDQALEILQSKSKKKGKK